MITQTNHQSWFWRWPIAFSGLVIAGLLPVLAHAQNTVLWTTDYYAMTGDTLGEIHQSLRRSRPWKATSNLDGLTVGRVDWRFGTTQLEGRCRFNSFTTKTTITITLPRWTAPTNVPPALSNAWHRYIRALGQHEFGHAQFALAAAAEQHKRIKELGEEPDCDTLINKINNLARQIVDEYRERDKGYDKRTDHGAKQGATLPRTLRDPGRVRE